jgi:hypothetical protein
MLMLARMTCPIAILGRYHSISVSWTLLANTATYAAAGLMFESLRRRLHPAK